MNRRELKELGLPGPSIELATRLIRAAAQAGMKKRAIREALLALARDPPSRAGDPHFGLLAKAILETPAPPRFEERVAPAPCREWGSGLEPQSREQMRNACRLPVSVAGALMPDAHVGYGLPIGGVLATGNAVIPYAVGVDIACRVKLSVLDLPVGALEGQADRLAKAIESETRFGVGAAFRRPREHEVMERDWSVTPLTGRLREKAAAQLGTSGSGNHFVEFGELTLARDDLGLPAGRHLALLSHSGSRGAGAAVADHYSRLAMDLHPELPAELRRLAWLDLDSEAGQEYWAAMSLMGEYAAANHAVIHDAIARHLGARVLLDVENHHNFAWRERHFGRDLIVHRKGATPAAPGALGIVPGSMSSPGYVVRGKGSPESLGSAAHGAGRVMSRTEARRRFRWSHVRRHLEERRVRLLSAGIDEVPMVYKDIGEVMAAQADLVEPVARFDPRIVKMCPDGERAED
jgi:tRNA-splicing ligase RtcB